MDALLGLACSALSPWALPEGASAEDRFLKELAVRRPRKIKDSFFYAHFTSLRVVDKQAREPGPRSVGRALPAWEGTPHEAGVTGEVLGRESPGPPPRTADCLRVVGASALADGTLGAQ